MFSKCNLYTVVLTKCGKHSQKNKS